MTAKRGDMAERSASIRLVLGAGKRALSRELVRSAAAAARKSSAGRTRLTCSGGDVFARPVIVDDIVRASSPREAGEDRISIECGRTLPDRTLLKSLSGRGVRILIRRGLIERLSRFTALLKAAGSGVEWALRASLTSETVLDLPGYMRRISVPGVSAVAFAPDWRGTWTGKDGKAAAASLRRWIKPGKAPSGVRVEDELPDPLLEGGLAVEPNGRVYPLGAVLLADRIPAVKAKSCLGELGTQSFDALEHRAQSMEAAWPEMFKPKSDERRVLLGALELDKALRGFFLGRMRERPLASRGAARR